MNMFTAIAQSAGNKARAINDNANIIIVQRLFHQPLQTHYYLWLITRGVVEHEDLFEQEHINALQVLYAVDPNANYWQPV